MIILRGSNRNNSPEPEKKSPKSTNMIVDWWQNLSKRNQKIIYGITGILVACLVVFLVWFNSPNETVNRMTKANNEALTQPIKKIPTNFAKFDYQGGTKTRTPDLKTLKKLRNESKDDVYLRGQVSIPSYDINVPIYEGISEYTLAWGAGTSKPHQVMGTGNYSLQAHNYIKKLDGVSNYAVNGWFFSRLQTRVAPYGAPTSSSKYNYFRVPVGTKVYTLNKDNVYTYEVEKHVVVPDVNKPGAGDVLADSEMKNVGDGKTPILTLCTCYIQNGVTYPKARMVYVCKLDKVTKRADFPDLDKVFHRNPNAASW